MKVITVWSVSRANLKDYKNTCNNCNIYFYTLETACYIYFLLYAMLMYENSYYVIRVKHWLNKNELVYMNQSLSDQI